MDMSLQLMIVICVFESRESKGAGCGAVSSTDPRHTLYKGRKLVPKDPLQHPLGSPRAMSRHISHSTLHEITLTGNGADSVRHRGVQTAYACARALKSCLSCRESALRRSYARTPRQAFYSHS